MKKIVCKDCGKNKSLTIGGNEKRIIMRAMSPIPCPVCQSENVEVIII